VLLSFYSFSVRNFNVTERERESKPSQVVVVTVVVAAPTEKND